MADNNTLHIDIEADVKGFTKGLKAAEGNLIGFTKATDKMTSKTNKMAKGVKSNAVPAMTSFSQIIQDAPYGINGVANNITQLTMQFGQLSTKTGGASAALKGMIGTLAGPAGILLAMSVVTSLLVKYGDKLNFAKTKADKLKKTQEDLVKSLDKFLGGLKSVDKAQLKGAKSSAKELTNLKLLKNQLDNNNLSNSERLMAFAELQKRYPTYLGNVSKEDALVGGLDTKYNELAAAILKTAKARAAATLISQNFQKILTLTLKLDKEKADLGKKAISNERANIALKEQGHLIDGATADLAIRTQQRYDKQLKTVIATAKSITTLHGNITKLSKEVEAQGGIIPLTTGKGGKTDDGFSVFKAQADASRKAREQEVSEYKKAQQELVNSLEKKEETIENWEDQRLDKMFKASAERLAIGARGNATELALYDAFVNSSKSQILTFSQWKNTQQGIEQQKTISSMMQFNEGIRGIIENSLAGTFAGIGEAIGTAFADGGNILQEGIMAITNGMAGLLSAMGDYLIKAGTAAVLAGTITKLFGSIAGVGAGIAAIAGGTLLKALSSGIKGFSGAGGGGGASAGGTNHARQSSFSGGSSGFSGGGSSGGGTFVFEIAGTKLIGVLKNTLDKNKALGGSDNLLFG